MKLIISFIFISFFHTCWANSRVALVFSGGGARGLAHIGVIKVLEENKIPIDFIVGNSMGSIIGGLYAAGYSAQQLEDEVRMIPWTQVFTDQSLRRNVSLRQKSLQDRVALSFPVRNGKVSLPTGLVKGNTLKKHLRRLCWPIRNIKNFNDLEIPFMAISTDILSGRAVQLTSGELAEAMQASMSLPSVFQPQKVDGKLLMDGMMIRNLPVQDAKETGADVLIAVDVGTKLYKETELNSIVNIIDQSISFMNVQTSAYQESLADVLIRPRVKDYTTGQFSDFDSLIKLGETAAREKLPQIKQILKSKGINASKSINRINPEEWSKPIRVEQITIEGLDKDLTRYIEKEFGNQYPLTMTQDEIEEIVDRVYGTDVFDWVTYEVHGHHLVLKLSPKETRDLNIGLNYNSDERLSMLINTRLRLVGLKTLKSELDIKLGQWNELESHNIFILNKKITKHTSLHNLIRIREFDISHADNLAPVDFHEYTGEFSLQTSANNNRRWLFGIRGRQIHLKDGFPHLNLQSQEDLWQLFAGFHYDSLDVSTFPTEGTLLYLDYEYAHEDMNDISDFSRQSFKFAKYNKLNTSSSIFGVYKESRAEGPVVSLHAKTYLGGQSKFLWDHTSFLGYKRLSSSGNYAQSLLLGYQNEIAPDLYFRALINAGLATDNKSDLYEYSKMKQAAGVELGYKARYGSAKIGVYHNREGTYSLYFDLGHRF